MEKSFLKKKIEMSNIAVVGYVGSSITDKLVSLTGGHKENARDGIPVCHFRGENRSFTAPELGNSYLKLLGTVPRSQIVLLAIDATTDLAALEAAMEKGSYLREAMVAVYANAVGSAIVCLDKMEATCPSYSEATYTQMVHMLSAMLEEFGFNSKLVSFVPLSTQQEENIVAVSSKLPWYEGLPLLKALDNIVPSRFEPLPTMYSLPCKVNGILPVKTAKDKEALKNELIEKCREGVFRLVDSSKVDGSSTSEGGNVRDLLIEKCKYGVYVLEESDSDVLDDVDKADDVGEAEAEAAAGYGEFDLDQEIEKAFQELERGYPNEDHN